MPQSENEMLPCGGQFQVRAMSSEVYGLRLLYSEETWEETHEVKITAFSSDIPADNIKVPVRRW